MRPDELGQVAELEKLCFKDPYPTYFLAQLAQDNPDTFVVAVSESKVVGYAVLEPWEDHSHLISIAVHPEARRRRIGSQLLTRLENGSAKPGELRLEVRRSNLAGIGFYRRHGFQEIGMQKGYYSDGEDAILMEKRLAD